MKIRIGASDKNKGEERDKAIGKTKGNKFMIPLNFEILNSCAPYYQAGLGNRLCYELTFNEYGGVVKSGPPKAADGKSQSPDAKYITSNISLEYDIITNPSLANMIRTQHVEMAVLYDRVLRHRKIVVNKSDAM